MTEQQIIDLLLGGPLDARRGLSAPGDDAVLAPGGAVVSVDTMVEGVHFDHRLSAADVGWKLVAVNASDIGACGRRPAWALLALSLPRDDGAWLAGFATGLRAALARWSIDLLGGDTTRSPGPRFASLTIGSPPTGPAVSRSGARPGDDLWVTGTLGRSAAGFLHATPGGLAWLRRPEPPVRFGARLGAEGLARAMMDLSDGLRTDLPRLCAASQTGAAVDPGALPACDDLPPGCSEAERLALMTAFGEDYELLFAADSSARDAIRAAAQAEGVSVSRIGQLTAPEQGVTLGGAGWPDARFVHF